MKLPLEGIRVLDLGTFIAGPFCSTLLGEFGAEVIKVEPPDGDGLRKFGTLNECGETLNWLNESRNKKSITLNLATQEGRNILKEMVPHFDVIVENFRPGVMKRWGLDYETLEIINPKLILIQISAYGQTGPYASKPGFARVAHAFSGLSYLSGEPDRPPVTPGSTSLADYCSGLYAAFGTMLALRARDHNGKGQRVDMALYESMFRMLDEIVPAFHKTGYVRERSGANTHNAAPHSHYLTADGKWVAIACTSDEIFARLARAMGKPQLSNSEYWETSSQRISEIDKVNQVVQEWAKGLSCEELLAICDENQVPAAKLLSIKDIFNDPQYLARGNLQQVFSQKSGELVLPGVIPKLSDTRGEIKWPGQKIGESNNYFYNEILGKSISDIELMKRKNII